MAEEEDMAEDEEEFKDAPQSRHEQVFIALDKIQKDFSRDSLTEDNLSDFDHPKEIVNDLFNNQVKMVTNFYLTKNYPPPLPPPPPIPEQLPPKLIYLATQCPQDYTKFQKFLKITIRDLIYSLPQKGIFNRTMRFFRGKSIDPSNLHSFTQSRQDLLNKTGLLSNEVRGPNDLSHINGQVTKGEYVTNYNTYCKSYIILKYILENQRKIPVKKRIDLLTDVVDLIGRGTSTEFCNNLFKTLQKNIKSFLTDILSHQNQPLLPRDSHTYHDLEKLIPDLLGNTHKGGSSRNTHRPTRRRFHTSARKSRAKRVSSARKHGTKRTHKR